MTLREVHARPLPSVELQSAAMARGYLDTGLKAMPIRAGRDEGSVTVQIVWALS